MMRTGATPPATIDEYIALFPEDIRDILQEIRRCVRGEAPGTKHPKAPFNSRSDEPVPFDLIRKIVAFRMNENLEKAGSRN